ncbi:nuclear transport factor 2 family protein [bacterium]|nr:MAG: nuclear transport factor 2 family protein [bacterium]
MDVAGLFAAIDARDAEAFGSYIAEGGIFRMGSYPPVQGPTEATEFVRGFFAGLDHVRHEILQTYEASGQLFIEGNVTYGLKNGKEVMVPFLNRLLVRGDKAEQYMIYLDPTPVAAAMA